MRALRPPKIALVWAAALWTAAGVMPADAATINCQLALPGEVEMTDPLPLKMTLSNPGKQTLHVLNWHTPFEGFFSRYLKVTGPQGEIAYGGALVKRGQPQRDEYLSIAPRTSVTSSANLRDVYKFDVPGTYRVEYIGQLADVSAEAIPRKLEQHTAQRLTCATLTVRVIAAG